VPRGKTLDALTSARCPGLPGDVVAFVVLADGRLVAEESVLVDSLAPLAEALGPLVAAPYRAVAARTRGDRWAAAAERVEIVELPGIEGGVIDLNVVGGAREVVIDGRPTIRSLPALDALAEVHGDVVLHAERVDADVFAVDVFPL
jgi:hypothetical protein